MPKMTKKKRRNYTTRDTRVSIQTFKLEEFPAL